VLAAILTGLLAQSPVAVSATVEPRFESLRYRFENPSAFDTVELVPHFFEQTYDSDNLWLGGRLQYPLFGRTADLTAAFTPQVTAQADDFDTFFNPGGNVIVSGTTGNASIRGWTIQQRVVVGSTAAAAYGIGYSYRRDSARYHEGTRIVTMTMPPSERRELVTTREFVTSQIHEVQVFATWRPAQAPAFSLLVEGAPVARGRLQVELPDKYPGRRLVFDANVSVVRAEAALTTRAWGVVLTGGLRVARSIPWRERARLTLTSVSALFSIGSR
jgi:hypothetical protein